MKAFKSAVSDNHTISRRVPCEAVKSMVSFSVSLARLLLGMFGCDDVPPRDCTLAPSVAFADDDVVGWTGATAATN